MRRAATVPSCIQTTAVLEIEEKLVACSGNNKYSCVIDSRVYIKRDASVFWHPADNEYIRVYSEERVQSKPFSLPELIANTSIRSYFVGCNIEHLCPQSWQAL